MALHKITIEKNQVNVSRNVYIQDTNGLPLTGLTFNSAGLVCYYKRAATDAKTALTLVTLASETAAWASGGFIEIDAVNLPGVYRLDFANAIMVTGIDAAIIVLSGAATMTPTTIDIELLNTLNVNAGVIEANPVQIGGDAQSLADLKDFADEGYDPVTNKIQGVVLVDTTATNSDMRGTDGANTTIPDNTTINAIAGYLDTEMTAVLLATQTTIPNLIAALNNVAPGDILTTQLTESYAALNAIPTLSQLLFEVRALLAEHSTTDVTKTVNQLDGTTPAATYTYDDAANPTAISRTT